MIFLFHTFLGKKSAKSANVKCACLLFYAVNGVIIRLGLCSIATLLIGALAKVLGAFSIIEYK